MLIIVKSIGRGAEKEEGNKMQREQERSRGEGQGYQKERNREMWEELGPIGEEVESDADTLRGY